MLTLMVVTASNKIAKDFFKKFILFYEAATELD